MQIKRSPCGCQLSAGRRSCSARSKPQPWTHCLALPALLHPSSALPAAQHHPPAEYSTMDGTSRVLLNASRSEAEELLREPPPPRPGRAHSGSLQDSAVFGRDNLYAPSDEDASPKGSYELHGRKTETTRLWAPPSRGSAGGGVGGRADSFRPASQSASDAGSAGVSG